MSNTSITVLNSAKVEEKRINKYISETGMCSRREADKLVENGAVTIDGKRAESGAKVSAGQVVKVHGQIVEGGFVPVVIAYNKPVGIVSTTDQKERDNIVNAIAFDERIFPIGRLDKDSQGLILLTNEGDIVNKILRAGNKHDKEYIVTANQVITDAFIQGMQSGVPILGVVTRKCELVKLGPCTFSIVLRQGLNRQIRRMCEHFGYDVVKLERIRIMHIKLGKLKQGQHRHLTDDEMRLLYKSLEQSEKTETKKPPKKGNTSHQKEHSAESRPAKPVRKNYKPTSKVSGSKPQRKSATKSVKSKRNRK